MSKFHIMTDTVDELRYIFQCPGCKCSHWVRARGPEPRWSVTGLKDDSPTVAPSIRVRSGAGMRDTCHSFVRNGKIEYLSDCTHSLAGQTVDIPNFEE